jgi:hypothetical protein
MQEQRPVRKSLSSKRLCQSRSLWRWPLMRSGFPRHSVAHSPHKAGSLLSRMRNTLANGTTLISLPLSQEELEAIKRSADFPISRHEFDELLQLPAGCPKLLSDSLWRLCLRPSQHLEDVFGSSSSGGVGASGLGGMIYTVCKGSVERRAKVFWEMHGDVGGEDDDEEIVTLSKIEVSQALASSAALAASAAGKVQRGEHFSGGVRASSIGVISSMPFLSSLYSSSVPISSFQPCATEANKCSRPLLVPHDCTFPRLSINPCLSISMNDAPWRSI